MNRLDLVNKRGLITTFTKLSLGYTVFFFKSYSCTTLKFNLLPFLKAGMHVFIIYIAQKQEGGHGYTYYLSQSEQNFVVRLVDCNLI